MRKFLRKYIGSKGILLFTRKVKKLIFYFYLKDKFLVTVQFLCEMELTNSKNNLKFSEITLTSNFLFDIISII